MEPQAFSIDQVSVALLPAKTPDLAFFPTAEGFYDYKKDQYIYQYKDHLGNARVSFGINSAGVLDIVDNNDYYPFGMNHLKTGTAFFGAGSYKNYKYNGKELQETGMYDYGWRQYMPDVARWMQLDPLVEDTEDPYAYVFNNPISLTDPDGRAPDYVPETDCCPDKSSSSLPSDPMEFASMTAGAFNSVRASVSNLFSRCYNEIADKRIDRKYVVDEIGQLVLISGVPAETRREKIENTLGDLATIALAATGGVQGSLLTQGGKAPLLKAVEEVKDAVKYSHLKDSKSVGPGKPFTSSQKNKIINENMKKNGGVIKSDLSGKVLDRAVQSKKGVKANMNQGEIDHVKAKSKGGFKFIQERSSFK